MSLKSFDEYSEEVFVRLREYSNFNEPDDEARSYLESEEVCQMIERDYEKKVSVAECAWGIDLLD